MNVPNGVILHNHKIPIKGISKKVIYHISDIHLDHSDDPAASQEPMEYESWLEGWPGFAIGHGEPHAESQMKPPEDHLACLLELANTGNAIVLTGDICDKVSKTNLRILDTALQTVTKPWLGVCGNHDLAADIPGDSLYARIRQPVQIMDLGDLLIVGVDDSQRQITAQQTEEFRRILALGKPVIVVLHIPVMTDGNRETLLPCGDYFRLNHPEATADTLAFIELLRQNAGQIAAVLAGHLHFRNESEIAPGLSQFVCSQSVLGNINRYEIGD